MMSPTRLGLIVPVVLSIAPTACAPGTASQAIRPEAPTATEAVGEDPPPPCDADPGYGEPLVIDLRANERLDLEIAMKDGIPVVRYDCNGLRLLKSCKLEGAYTYAGVSLKEDVLQLKDQDEVRVNLPLTGAKLSAEMTRGMTFDLALIFVGKRSVAVDHTARTELSGDCDGATHFVRAAAVGAFAMQRGSGAKVGAAATLFVSAEASSSSRKTSVVKDGILDECKKATSTDSSPPQQCGSAIRLELVPLAEEPIAQTEPKATKPGPLINPCPPDYLLTEGKCTKTQSEAPYLCAPTDKDQCKAQCDKGNAGSCYHLALQSQEMVITGEMPLNKLRALFRKACDGGAAPACFHAAAVWEQGRARDLTKAHALYRRGCDLGDRGTCIYFAQAVEKGNAPLAHTLYKRACDLGSVFACRRVGAKGNTGAKPQPTP